MPYRPVGPIPGTGTSPCGSPPAAMSRDPPVNVRRPGPAVLRPPGVASSTQSGPTPCQAWPMAGSAETIRRVRAQARTGPGAGRYGRDGVSAVLGLSDRWLCGGRAPGTADGRNGTVDRVRRTCAEPIPSWKEGFAEVEEAVAIYRRAGGRPTGRVPARPHVIAGEYGGRAVGRDAAAAGIEAGHDALSTTCLAKDPREPVAVLCGVNERRSDGREAA